MNLVKYAPFDTMDTLFDRLNRGLFPAFPRVFEDEGEDQPIMRLPRTNIEESDGHYVFSMEMPGVAKKDVDVSVEKDMLVVKGEKTVKTEDKKLLRREFRSTKFERSFVLGGDIDQDGIQATMEDGILKISVPKKPEKVGRKVNIS